MTEDLSSSGSPDEDWTEESRRRAHFEAAEILTWGGLSARNPEPRPLPDHWVDVTDVVLAALERVRGAETSNGDSV